MSRSSLFNSTLDDPRFPVLIACVQHSQIGCVPAESHLENGVAPVNPVPISRQSETGEPILLSDPCTLAHHQNVACKTK